MAFRNLPEMPCGPILELHGQRKRFHVPYGLKKLLEDITREVLRVQPDNIYDFLAHFMEARGQRKKSEDEKKKQRKSWQVHRWSWEGKSILEPEDLKEFLATLSISEDVTTHHAVVIQSAFRGYQARKKVKEIRKSGERASVGSKDAREFLRSSKLVEALVIEIDKLSPETATDAEMKSATVIQSAFRGMQTRKMMKEKKSLQEDGIEVEGLNEEEANKAADAQEQEQLPKTSDSKQQLGGESEGEEADAPTTTKAKPEENRQSAGAGAEITPDNNAAPTSAPLEESQAEGATTEAEKATTA